MRDRWIPRLAAALVLLSVSCSSLRSDFDVEIQPEEGFETRVVLRFRGDESGQTECAIAERWGGSSSEGEWFRDFSASAEDGDVTVAVASPTSLVLQHEPGSVLELQYRIVDLPRSSTAVDDYRPIRNSTSFMMVPALGVFFPTHLGWGKEGVESEIDVELTWCDLDDLDWRAFSSFGLDEGPLRRRLTPSRFRESLLLAGSRDHAIRSDGEGLLATVEVGTQASFSATELADELEPILRGVRGWFRDRDESWYLVAYVPAGEVVEGRVGLGGTALTDAFLFYVDPSVELTADPDLFRSIAHVLCHETVHRWNGVLFRLDEPDYEGQASWFSEGFTEFASRWILAAVDILDLQTYLEAINARIREYETSPDRDRRFREVVESGGEAASAQALAYQRGELIALWVDDEVRRRTDGGESLRDLMVHLTKRAKAGERIFPESAVWDWVAERCGAGFVDRVRTVLAEGGAVPLPEDLFGRPFVLERSPDGVPRYRLGDAPARDQR